MLAEGVETEEARVLLRDMGVDLVEGYLFGRPQPVVESATVTGDPSRSLPVAAARA